MEIKDFGFNEGKLMKNVFSSFPLGAIKPEGWLKNQLRLQSEGITADMKLYPDYRKETSAWLGGTGESGERGPYFLRGLIPCAVLSEKDDLLSEALQWINSIISSQKSDGSFGPSWCPDGWWVRMPVLMALRDYYEYTEFIGSPDVRIIPFLEKYFRFQLSELNVNPIKGWGSARGGDNIESVFWLYERLFDSENPDKTDWLLDLAELIHSQTQNWTEIMNETAVRQHVVNTSQALKTPPLWYRYSKDEKDREAIYNGLKNIMKDHGRIDRLPNSDEAARDNQSYRGTELCGIVEGMLSYEIAVKILGDSSFGDNLEWLAYNALPCAYSPDYKSHVYYILQNQVLATNGSHEFDCDHGDSSSFGAPDGYDCCFSNNHMGWPKFIESLVMRTRDCGIAVIAYAPCRLDYTGKNGERILLKEITDYPFDEIVGFEYEGDNAEFSLMLRIPSWASEYKITVNGTDTVIPAMDGFANLSRKWTYGDVIQISFKCEITLCNGYNRSVAVTRGPLIYSLKIEEDWREYSDNGARELKVPVRGKLLNREVYPMSRWNYGLVPDVSSMSFERRKIPFQPFDSNETPNVIHACGQIVPEWKLDGNHSGTQPFNGVLKDSDSLCEIDLIPYGAARLKITHFPRIGDGGINLLYDNPTYYYESGRTVSVFSGITLAPAEDYEVRITPESEGIYTFFVNSVRCYPRSDVIKSLKRVVDGAEPGKYLEMRAEGQKLLSVEIVPINPEIMPVAEKITSGYDFALISLNIDRSDFGYEIDYGLSGEKLSRHMRGFKGRTALIAGLEPETSYDFVINSVMGGKNVRSERFSFTTVASEQVESITDYYNAADDGFDFISDSSNYKYEKGLLAVNSTDDFKAVSIGKVVNEGHLEVKMCPRSGPGNCGLILNVSDCGNGPDNYCGYYFGIGDNNFTAGKADGRWNQICEGKLVFEREKVYTLSVDFKQGWFIFSVDGSVICSFCDKSFSSGLFGLRSYLKSFAAADFSVRPLNEEDNILLEKYMNGISGGFEVKATTAFETIQVSYPKIYGANYYRIDYGTAPGLYTNVVTDILFNNYKGGGIFDYDKVAFTFTGADCYFKMSAWADNRLLASSEEIHIDMYEDITAE